MGRNIDIGVLVESLGDELPEAADPVNWSALSAFLEPAGEDAWRFRHNMQRDVAYGSLPFSVRKRLHGRIGEVLEDRSEDAEKDADLLSLHFALAGDHGRAWQYSKIAGERARQQYANVAAADFFQRAVESGRHVSDVPPEDIADVYEALGDVNEIIGIFDRADTAYRSARQGVRDDKLRTAELMVKQGLLREKTGDLTQALRWFGRGLTLLEDESSDKAREVRTELRIAYAGVKFRQGQFQDCVEWCEQGLEGLGHDEFLPQQAHALHLLVLALAHLRRPIDDLGERALEIYTGLGDQVGLGNVLTNIGVDAYYKGDWDTALELYQRSEDARRTAGDVIGAAASANNIAEIYSDQGRLTEAIELFREALAVWEGAQFQVGIALANLNLGRADARAGMSDLAHQRLDTAQQMFSEMGAQSYIVDTEVRRAEAFLLNGEFDRATKLAESLLHDMSSEEHNQLFEATLYRVLGYCCQAEGDHEHSLVNFEQGLRLAHESDSAFEAALILEGLLRFFGEDGRGTEWQFEEERLFQRLGIIATPVVPLGDAGPIEVGVKTAIRGGNLF